MKKILLLIVAAVCLIPSGASAKDDSVKAYLFGFAASFNDSIVYLTDIQEVTPAYVTHKHKHLVDRSEYSYQLRNHITGLQQGAHPTVVTFYALNRKAAEKKHAKIKRKYTEKTKGRYIMRYVKQEEFQYQPVSHEQ